MRESLRSSVPRSAAAGTAAAGPGRGGARGGGRRTYPPARRGDQVDDYHGEAVSDPYRWLEGTDDPETVAWVRAENQLTEAFLAAVPTREEIRSRLTDLLDYPKFGVPFERGGVWFETRNPGLQDQPVLWVTEEPGSDGRVLLDPNVLSPDGTVAVTGIEVSEDGSRVAYATSAGGSDWKIWRVREVATASDLDDVIEWSKFSPVAWRKDGSGFYYAALEPPPEGAEYLDESRLERIFFHRLGAGQADDELVFSTPDQIEWLLAPAVTDDGRFLVISIHRGTFPQAQVRVLDLEDPEAGFRSLVSDFASKAVVLTNVGTTFFLLTDDSADLQRVVAVDLDRPERAAWREVVPEGRDLLLEAYAYGGRLVCHFLRHACSVLRVYDLDGTHVRDIPTPAMTSVSSNRFGGKGIEGRATSDLVHFEVTSFTESGSLWAHDLSTGETKLVRPSSAAFDAASYVTEQVFVPSGDGTRVPVFLSRRRELTASGDVPVLLYGYGGFDVPITPAFSVTQALWMERGGMLAVANLRGGGEYGTAWHDAGRLARKQNVFDDFCSCAKWLAASGWSRPDRIAINGASNGGLLVGACITQHPELFGAGVAEVGVLDMLRFNKFTIGWAWTSDFGDPDDPDQYRWLRAYSPLHRIQPGAHYPPMLVLTGDHDDRVVPGHSFKFAAALQAAQAGEAPVLIRVETAAGHGAGKPTAKLVAERTDVLAFLEEVLGLAPGT